MSDETAKGLIILSECCGKYGAHAGPDMAKMKMELAAARAEVERANARQLDIATFIGEVLPLHVQHRGPIDALRWFSEQLAALSAANAELRKALEPFADKFSTITNADARLLIEIGSKHFVAVGATVADCRRAAAALIAAPAPEPADERDKRIEELEDAVCDALRFLKRTEGLTAGPNEAIKYLETVMVYRMPTETLTPRAGQE
jgi:hypothetical protein